MRAGLVAALLSLVLAGGCAAPSAGPPPPEPYTGPPADLNGPPEIPPPAGAIGISTERMICINGRRVTARFGCVIGLTSAKASTKAVR